MDYNYPIIGRFIFSFVKHIVNILNIIFDYIFLNIHQWYTLDFII